MVVFCPGYGSGIGLFHSCPRCGLGCGFGLCDFLWVDPLVGCVFLLPHWFVWFLKPELWAVLWFFPVPGLWACVISGRYAWFPCLWGLVFMLVAGSSKLRIIWWFCIGLMPLFLYF